MQRRGRHVHEMARQVEREPAISEEPGLEAGGVGHRDDQHAARLEQSGGMADHLTGVAQMLERMPEDHAREAALDLAHVGADDVVALRGALDADRLASPRAQCGEQRAVARADVEDRRPAGRSGRVARRAARGYG